MPGSSKNEIAAGMTGGLKIVLTFIGVLTLAIGGVGIMNIMFVNVQERTGNRRPQGARGQAPRDSPAVPAGRAGHHVRRRVSIAVSCGLVWLLSPRPFLASCRRRQPRDRHSPGAVGAAVAVTSAILMMVGLVSGLLPALKASAGSDRSPA